MQEALRHANMWAVGPGGFRLLPDRTAVGTAAGGNGSGIQPTLAMAAAAVVRQLAVADGVSSAAAEGGARTAAATTVVARAVVAALADAFAGGITEEFATIAQLQVRAFAPPPLPAPPLPMLSPPLLPPDAQCVAHVVLP